MKLPATRLLTALGPESQIFRHIRYIDRPRKVLFGVLTKKPGTSVVSPWPVMAMRRTALLARGSVLGSARLGVAVDGDAGRVGQGELRAQLIV